MVASSLRTTRNRRYLPNTHPCRRKRMALGIVCKSGIATRSPLWIIVLAGVFVGLWARARLGGGLEGTAAAAAMIVAGAVFMPALAHNPVSGLGDASSHHKPGRRIPGVAGARPAPRLAAVRAVRGGRRNRVRVRNVPPF